MVFNLIVSITVVFIAMHGVVGQIGPVEITTSSSTLSPQEATKSVPTNVGFELAFPRDADVIVARSCTELQCAYPILISGWYSKFIKEPIALPLEITFTMNYIFKEKIQYPTLFYGLNAITLEYLAHADNSHFSRFMHITIDIQDRDNKYPFQQQLVLLFMRPEEMVAQHFQNIQFIHNSQEVFHLAQKHMSVPKGAVVSPNGASTVVDSSTSTRRQSKNVLRRIIDTF